ncbi:non-canonical purine NTP pyrophosphatase [Patescibacteria group bacterium]|nr:non-canonical purine NTP pyrophosphatase [Patescibacteria group bacterium]
MKVPIIFITGHPQKAEQLSWHLEYPVTHQSLDLPEIQSLDPVEVVTHKTKAAYKKIKRPVLVEDISVRFTAMGKLPGTLIKWFLHELGDEGLCRLLDGYNSRKAIVEPFFAFYDGKEVKIFTASIEGEIAKAPRGENGFGLDSIFIPKGYVKTWGEMTKEELVPVQVCRIAIKKLQKFLLTL